MEGILMRGPKKQAIVCCTAEGLVEKVENFIDFSTDERLKTKVFHKVMHIIHRRMEKRMWKKWRQTPFLRNSESPEISEFFIFEKRKENGLAIFCQPISEKSDKK